ncbi:hypothetical protein FACS1894137_05670 [Spirochaetia bacterium]|nr:hypothetical protein FACS1894137_05670 [Spirochaetia bacterium]
MGTQAKEWIDGLATEIATKQINFANKRIAPDTMSEQMQQDTIDSWKQIITSMWNWLMDIPMDDPSTVQPSDPDHISTLRQALQPSVSEDGED